ncbi:PIN domain protein [uncultured archaeon]|nr:PIN domain protein [uncultured archaeon]
MPKSSFYIDSCIFLGTVIQDENTRSCKSFISRIKNGVFTGYISTFVTGEMINSILYSDNIKPKIKSEILHAVTDMLISTKLENFVPSKNDMMVYSKLREADSRISESDLMHVACAKILDIPLVTTDDKMLKSRGLKKHVDIVSPADVLGI